MALFRCFSSRHLCAAGLALGALLLPLGTGCGTGGGSHSSPAGSILRYPLLASPTTFDPAMVQDGTTMDMLQQVYEGLVQWTPRNTLAPCLAEKWDVSRDGLTYTFHLRKGVTFQDGRPFTAADVYYSLRRALDPALKSQVALTYLGDIVGASDVNHSKAHELAGVKVVDPQTVAIRITKPKAYWLMTLTYPTAYVISRAEADKVQGPVSDRETALGAGTGPYRLTRYDKDSRVVLDANPKYWGGVPGLKGQERPIVKDAATRHALYMNGQIDLLQYEQQGDLAADLKDPQLKSEVHYFSRASTFYVALNLKAFPAFRDVRVRQALAYATDKDKVRHVVLHDIVDVAEDLLPKGIPGFDPNFRGLPYDPVKARALLAAAGYPGGQGFPTIPMYYRESFPELVKTVDVLRQMWHDNLGITVEPRQTEWGALLDMEDKNALPCYHIRWAADYLDPQDFYSVLLRTGSVENHVLYSNPRFDALCDAADIEQNPARRQALYRKAARIAADEVPRIPLYYQKDIELAKSYVHHLDQDDSLMSHLPYKHLTLGP